MRRRFREVPELGQRHIHPSTVSSLIEKIDAEERK
jgi:hypothetical protein